MRTLEAKRDAVVIENEELVSNYYRIRQQLQRMEKEIQVGVLLYERCVYLK